MRKTCVKAVQGLCAAWSQTMGLFHVLWVEQFSCAKNPGLFTVFGRFISSHRTQLLNPFQSVKYNLYPFPTALITITTKYK